MKKMIIAPDRLAVGTHSLWDEQWLLLGAGDFSNNKFNAMTVGWGSLGTMWGKPFAQIVVRPTRHTFEFLEKYPSFTLSAFPTHFRDDLLVLGTKSGRDSDKIRETQLTPCESTQVAAPSFQESELSIECRTMYWQDMDPGQFLKSDIISHYPQSDFHRIYFGEIVAILGIDRYHL